MESCSTGPDDMDLFTEAWITVKFPKNDDYYYSTLALFPPTCTDDIEVLEGPENDRTLHKLGFRSRGRGRYWVRFPEMVTGYKVKENAVVEEKKWTGPLTREEFALVKEQELLEAQRLKDEKKKTKGKTSQLPATPTSVPPSLLSTNSDAIRTNNILDNAPSPSTPAPVPSDPVVEVEQPRCPPPSPSKPALNCNATPFLPFKSATNVMKPLPSVVSGVHPRQTSTVRIASRNVSYADVVVRRPTSTLAPISRPAPTSNVKQSSLARLAHDNVLANKIRSASIPTGHPKPTEPTLGSYPTFSNLSFGLPAFFFVPVKKSFSATLGGEAFLPLDSWRKSVGADPVVTSKSSAKMRMLRGCEIAPPWPPILPRL